MNIYDWLFIITRLKRNVKNRTRSIAKTCTYILAIVASVILLPSILYCDPRKDYILK